MFVTTGTRISAQEPYAESVVALDAKRVLHAFRFPAGP
jgi:hypothetical protein